MYSNIIRAAGHPSCEDERGYGVDGVEKGPQDSCKASAKCFGISADHLQTLVLWFVDPLRTIFEGEKG